MRKWRFRADILSVFAVIIVAKFSTSVIMGPILVSNVSSYNGLIHCAAIASVFRAAYSASQVL